MASGTWFGRVILVGLFAAVAQAQWYPGLGPAWGGYSQIGPGAYVYGYGYPFDYLYSTPYLPPSSGYLLRSFSYNANPYATLPNSFPYGGANPYMPSFSYEVPQDAYAPNTFTYDLQAYAYGYPPPLYSPPVYPYSYYPYYPPGRQYWRMIYREMTLGQYIRKQLHGPVRVRDIVPGIPELGVQTRWQG